MAGTRRWPELGYGGHGDSVRARERASKAERGGRVSPPPPPARKRQLGFRGGTQGGCSAGRREVGREGEEGEGRGGEGRRGRGWVRPCGSASGGTVVAGIGGRRGEEESGRPCIFFFWGGSGVGGISFL